jgi:hypothetical protein
LLEDAKQTKNGLDDAVQQAYDVEECPKVQSFYEIKRGKPTLAIKEVS